MDTILYYIYYYIAHILDYMGPYQIYDLWIFFLFYGLCFHIVGNVLYTNIFNFYEVQLNTPDICGTVYGGYIYIHTHINIHKIKVILEQTFKNSNYIKRISGCLETYFRGKKKKGKPFKPRHIDPFAMQKSMQ